MIPRSLILSPRTKGGICRIGQTGGQTGPDTGCPSGNGCIYGSSWQSNDLRWLFWACTSCTNDSSGVGRDVEAADPENVEGVSASVLRYRESPSLEP